MHKDLLIQMVKKLQYFIVLLSTIFAFSSFKFIKIKAPNEIKIIVIDAGHGGKDPGCLGAVYKEKDVALGVALKFGKYIEENFKDIRVIYTRTSDVFVDLEDRAQIANKAKADLFISIHCNAAGTAVMVTDRKTGKKIAKTFVNKKGKRVVIETTNPEPFGTETYVMGLKNEEGKMKVATRENSAIFYEDDYEKKYSGFDPESIESYIIMSNYTSAYVIQSANLAVKIQAEYIKKAGRIDKGVHRQSIWVLWRTSMPSILTEIGYLTNPLEEQFLGSEKGQEYLAKALFRGLRNYKDELAGNKIVYNDEFENQSPLENENILAGNIPGQKKADTNSFSNKPILEPVSENTTSIVQTKDTVVLKNLNNYKAATAQEIALNFKKNKTADFDNKSNSIEATKTETALPSFKIIEKTNEVYIVFKVLFASSGAPIDLKQEKYSAIKEGSFFIENKVLKYTSGSFGLIGEAVAHKLFLRNNGFNDCFVIALKNGERIDINEAKKLVAP